MTLFQSPRIAETNYIPSNKCCQWCRCITVYSEAISMLLI